MSSQPNQKHNWGLWAVVAVAVVALLAVLGYGVKTYLELESLLDTKDAGNLPESYESMEAEGGVLSESVDINGKIREKYTIMIDFFESKYDFDIQAIGNDVE